MLSTQSVKGYTANVAAVLSTHEATAPLEASNDAHTPGEVHFIDIPSYRPSPAGQLNGSVQMAANEARAALADADRVAALL